MDVFIITRCKTRYKFVRAALQMQYNSQRAPLFIPQGIVPSPSVHKCHLRPTLIRGIEWERETEEYSCVIEEQIS